MAPYAICLGQNCGFAFDFCEDDAPDGQTTRTAPDHCPRCGGTLLFYCPNCFRAIPRIPTASGSFCEHCGKRLLPRRVLARGA